MKNANLTTSLIFLLVLTLFASACKKGQEPDPEPDTTPSQQLTKDENLFKRANDEVIQDATILAVGNKLKATQFLPCNANVDSVLNKSDSTYIYVTFNGTNCAGFHHRTGKMLIRKAKWSYWILPGATMITEVSNYKLTHLAANKTIELSGKFYIQNVSGGNLALLGNPYPSIVHKSWGYMRIVLPSDKEREWHYARQMIYSQTIENLIITEDGFGAANGYDKLSSWGTTRNGQLFYNQITQPVVMKKECGFRPSAGIQKQFLPEKELTSTITFGYNDQNQPVASNECATRLRLDWQKKNNSGTLYLPLQ